MSALTYAYISTYQQYVCSELWSRSSYCDTVTSPNLLMDTQPTLNKEVCILFASEEAVVQISGEYHSIFCNELGRKPSGFENIAFEASSAN